MCSCTLFTYEVLTIDYTLWARHVSSHHVTNNCSTPTMYVTYGLVQHVAVGKGESMLL